METSRQLRIPFVTTVLRHERWFLLCHFHAAKSYYIGTFSCEYSEQFYSIPLTECLSMIDTYIICNNNNPVVGKLIGRRQDRSIDSRRGNAWFSSVWFCFGQNASFQVSRENILPYINIKVHIIAMRLH